ncbi:MAG: radical SAM family heme chaperone HemW [Candidatus Babeliales bacterium]|jgi:oxygen-independent coproporphyrinogen-3 oxidase
MKLFPHHLYIHWPFCHSKCAFCDFVAFQNHEEFQSAYLQALCREITTYCADYQSQDRSVSTIFIGGGTPSLCPLDAFQQIFRTLRQECDVASLHECSIEANPSDITEERLAVWRECGVNRLSIGVQCLDDTVLRTLNRTQRVSDVERALTLAPQYFDNVSVDLILGLPGITEQAWRQTIAQVVTWPIKHMSVYFLMLHEKTPLAFARDKGLVQLMEEPVLVDLYTWTVQEVERHGFIQYEISNFAQPGYESIHNRAYWDRKPYRGFGLGAASFDGASRQVTTNNLTAYLTNRQGGVPQSSEVLTASQVFLEHLMLGLRQKKGLDLQGMVYFLNDYQKTEFNSKVTDLIAAGLMEEYDGGIRLTLKGMVVENEVVVWLTTL